MDDVTYQAKMGRVRELLRIVRHVPIATTNADGSPHLSPVFMAFDDQLGGFWASHPSANHSQNIARDGRVFLTVFDALPGQGTGLYLQGRAQELHTDTPDFRHAYNVIKKAKDETGAPLAPQTNYLLPDAQRIYRFVPEKMWFNASEKDPNGVIIRDRRYEIVLDDIKQKGD